MIKEIFKESDVWVREKGPEQHVVISSRARLARNISMIPFATHANSNELEQVSRIVEQTVQTRPTLKSFRLIILRDMSPRGRKYLKESHIISPEMEKGDEYRSVYISPDFHLSIMVNEEDHLRIQGLVSGLQFESVLDRIFQTDVELTDPLNVAFSEQFGYLTACPTNLGTGLRVSVMLHLPGLVLSRKIEETVQMIQPHGLTIRGFYGENSEFDGDFYQISNEVSLGKNEEEIVALFLDVIRKVIDMEEKTRKELFSEQSMAIEDKVWRAYGLLTRCRMVDTQEAMKLLSRIRLGIDRGYFKSIDHEKLNELIIRIQPAHLEILMHGESGNDARDIARASLLRNFFHLPGSEN